MGDSYNIKSRTKTIMAAAAAAACVTKNSGSSCAKKDKNDNVLVYNKTKQIGLEEKIDEIQENNNLPLCDITNQQPEPLMIEEDFKGLDSTQNNSEKSIWDISNITDFIYVNGVDQSLENISFNSSIFNFETENTKHNLSTFDSSKQEAAKKYITHSVNIIQPADNSANNSVESVASNELQNYNNTLTETELKNQQEASPKNIVILDVHNIIQPADNSANNSAESVARKEFQNDLKTLAENDLKNQQEASPKKIVILDVVTIIQPSDNAPELVLGEEFTNDNNTLTKKGNTRKRRKFSASLEERKEQRLQQKKEKMQLKPPCNNESCRRNCIKNIPEETRVIINKNFQKLNFVEKKRFIINNTSYKVINETKEHSKRSQSIQYFFQNDTGKRIQICKPFFLGTLGYNIKNDRFVLQTVSNHHRDHIPVTPDMRGKIGHKVKFNKKIIQKHIESFHPSISHYRREHAPNRRYLPSDISVALMFQDFVEKFPDFNCSYETYRRQVKAMNISFTRLGNEECENCAVFENHCHSKDNLQENCKECQDYGAHIKKVKKSRALYRSDAELDRNGNDMCFSADLQKVIMLPRMEQYKITMFTPRIIVFNESFVPVGTKQSALKPNAVIWHEGTAGRKKEDLISSFYSFFLEHRDATKISLWLDNCSAQNKNWTLLSFLVYIVNSEEINTQEITVKYFEPGHTFMSADSFHHQVELSMKFQDICDFKDFKNAVQKCNSGKVNVIELKKDNFYDWLDHTSQVKLKKLQPRPYLSDITTLKAERGNNFLRYSNDYEIDNLKELHFLKVKSEKEGIPLANVRLTARGINTEKKEEIIKKLCPLMKEDRRVFWVNLPESTKSNDLNESFE